MRVRRSLAALLAAPALLLAACGGGSSVADPPASSGPTSSPPTSQPPAHESPQHFIRRFYVAEKRMENTGKTSLYLTLTDNCAPCSGLAQQVRSYYEAGGYIRWSGLSIRSISVFSADTGKGPSYSIKFDAQPTHYKKAANSPTQRLPGGPSTDVLTLNKTRTSWTVVARGRFSP